SELTGGRLGAAVGVQRRQTSQRRAVIDGVVGDQEVCPRFAAMGHLVLGGVVAPLGGGTGLRLHVSIGHFVGPFGLAQVLVVFRLHDEVRLVGLVGGIEDAE